MLGEALLDRLARLGWQRRTLAVTGLMESQEGRARLSGEFLGADLTVLAAPVYVDAPPAPVVRAMEFLAEEPGQGSRGRRFAAVFACGFPESFHTGVCLDACRLFAREAGLEWAGGLGVGGGGALGHGPLESRGRMARKVIRALDLAAEALDRGGSVPEEAVRLAGEPLIPHRLYLFLAEAGWLARAWKRRTLFKLGATPFRRP